MVEHPGFVVDRSPDRTTLERRSGEAIGEALREALDRREKVRVVFASAASQSGTLAVLLASEGIDWSRVEAFHMDEYIGLPAGHGSGFGNWLNDRLFARLPQMTAHLIVPGPDAEAETERYAQLLAEAPIDLVCLGIGVNGHIAFNDPPVADFNDPKRVKVVELDLVCRQQQVDDGAFATVADVPTHAITLTVPQLMEGKRLICVVPGAAKADAVYRTIHGPIETACPSSILRRHADCRLFVDRESCPQ